MTRAGFDPITPGYGADPLNEGSRHAPRIAAEGRFDCLRAELAAEQSTTAAGTTRGAWLAFMRFGRMRWHTAPQAGSDSLLFQYGTYVSSGRPMFTVDLTRQLNVSDDSEHDQYLHVRCELRYTPALDLDAWEVSTPGSSTTPVRTSTGGSLPWSSVSGRFLFASPLGSTCLRSRYSRFGRGRPHGFVTRAGHACAGGRSLRGRTSGA